MLIVIISLSIVAIIKTDSFDHLPFPLQKSSQHWDDPFFGFAHLSFTHLVSLRSEILWSGSRAPASPSPSSKRWPGESLTTIYYILEFIIISVTRRSRSDVSEWVTEVHIETLLEPESQTVIGVVRLDDINGPPNNADQPHRPDDVRKDGGRRKKIGILVALFWSPTLVGLNIRRSGCIGSKHHQWQHQLSSSSQFYKMLIHIFKRWIFSLQKYKLLRASYYSTIDLK